jgi:hypothetical protein
VNQLQFADFAESDTQRAALVRDIRKHAGGMPMRDALKAFPQAQPLQNLDDWQGWLMQAADALEQGKNLRAAHHLLWAIYCTEDVIATALAKLAAEGRKKLEADKRRGRRT